MDIRELILKHLPKDVEIKEEREQLSNRRNLYTVRIVTKEETICYMTLFYTRGDKEYKNIMWENILQHLLERVITYVKPLEWEDNKNY